jgi:polar amino acid transport system permease protein
MAGLRQLGTQRIGWVLDVLTYVFRGIPVLVLLFMVYFGLFMAIANSAFTGYVSSI